MSLRTCNNGHTFEKTSNCPVCPICSAEAMNNEFGKEFPRIGAPAFRALSGIGVNKLSDLTKYSEEELLALHGFGPRALRLLKDVLKQNNLKLKAS